MRCLCVIGVYYFYLQMSQQHFKCMSSQYAFNEFQIASYMVMTNIFLSSLIKHVVNPTLPPPKKTTNNKKQTKTNQWKQQYQASKMAQQVMVLATNPRWLKFDIWNLYSEENYSCELSFAPHMCFRMNAPSSIHIRGSHTRVLLKSKSTCAC